MPKWKRMSKSKSKKDVCIVRKKKLFKKNPTTFQFLTLFNSKLKDVRTKKAKHLIKKWEILFTKKKKKRLTFRVQKSSRRCGFPAHFDKNMYISALMSSFMSWEILCPFFLYFWFSSELKVFTFLSRSRIANNKRPNNKEIVSFKKL